MTIDLPAPVLAAIDAANANDTDAFLASLTPDGVVDDWGREFRGPDAGVAYDEGSAFCLWVARTFGAAKLRALYREFAGSSPTSPGDLDRGFRDVLGLSRRTAERRWAAWVRGQA